MKAHYQKKLLIKYFYFYKKWRNFQKFQKFDSNFTKKMKFYNKALQR